ncbi:MAG: low molecular weight protein-tyrosine-phosphatase [Alphaproteobacteria bacterium]
MIRVLFVCMGNICRSPTAEGIFRAMVQEAGLDHLVEIDSAGTHGYHVGEPPDPRAQNATRQRGVEIGSLRARKFHKDDFEDFDYVLAMDRQNHAILMDLCPPEHSDRLHLFLSFAEGTKVHDVPDPYYGNVDRFDVALELIEQGAAGLLAEIRLALDDAKA